MAENHVGASKPALFVEDGPWLLWSAYWGRWHRRSDTGGACGYTDDIAQAGVFDYAKASAYNDPPGPNCRDVAIPAREAIQMVAARVEQKKAEFAHAQGVLDHIRRATGQPEDASPHPGEPRGDAQRRATPDLPLGDA